jgi:hypothetical protein
LEQEEEGEEEEAVLKVEESQSVEVAEAVQWTEETVEVEVVAREEQFEQQRVQN